MTSTPTSRETRLLAIILALLGVLLTATTIKGAFIIDEINYAVTVLGLRQGTLMVPGTAAVAPSKELFYFDPESENRVATSTPVASLAPPLYAPIALPFSVAGWRGLAFLNTLSFLLSAYLIFSFVRRHAVEASSAWIALGTFILGGFSLEYAQGVWPHTLSVALCTAALILSAKVWEGENTYFAFLSGLLFGIACGVREQNVFLAACLGFTLLLFGTRKLLSAVQYAAGAAIPLIASSTINYFRLGIWFPSPKVFAYTRLVTSSSHSGSWLEPLEVFWVKIVDFSAFRYFHDAFDFIDFSREPSTGAYLAAGIVKKALLHSSPWIALALVIAVLVWFRRSDGERDRRRILRALSLLLLPTLAIFSAAGFRTDGLSFNQRYLLELVPIAAILVACSIDGLSLSPFHIVVGALSASLLFAATLFVPGRDVLHLATLRMPLVFALLVLAGWYFAKRSQSKALLAVSLGLCIGWSFSVQIIDLVASRSIRERNATILENLDRTIPDHSALVAYWGMQKAAAGPLQLSKDVLILDPWADGGKDAPGLVRTLARSGKRVFMFATGVPEQLLESIKGPDSLGIALAKPFLLYEFIEKRRNVSEKDIPDRPSNPATIPHVKPNTQSLP